MEQISPLGPVYQAGTLSGNPLAMSAGVATMEYITNHPEIYNTLEEKGAKIEAALRDALKDIGKDYAVNRVGSMICLFFTEEKVDDFNSAVSSDTKLYASYFHKMLDSGIYLAPAQFEAMFVSLAHSDKDLDITISAVGKALREIH
jgi:glutamate-1-semialdehyde 2,1-aminomutase